MEFTPEKVKKRLDLKKIRNGCLGCLIIIISLSFIGSFLKTIISSKSEPEIIAELKTIPESEYKKNKELYQQLNILSPKNESYINKLNYYTQKVERQTKIERQFDSWDGSHYNLTKYVKSSMNDPRSYEHIKTTYWDRGDYLIIRTTFRGTNIFGGIVTNTVAAKVTLNGEILEIIN